MLTQEEIQNIISSVQPEIIEQESVGNNLYRPLKNKYVHDGKIVMEHMEYVYPANSNAWGAVKSVNRFEVV